MPKIEDLSNEELEDMFLDSVTELSKREYIKWCDGDIQETTLKILIPKRQATGRAMLQNGQHEKLIASDGAMAKLRAHLQNLGFY